MISSVVANLGNLDVGSVHVDASQGLVMGATLDHLGL